MRAASSTQSRRSAWVYLLVLLSLCIFIPRLISPQFGLFDDGNTVYRAREVLGGNLDVLWEGWGARSWPVYWLYLVWMIVWVAFYLPWRYTVEYYLLPFSAGASVLGAWLIDRAMEIYPRLNRWARGVAIFALVAAAALFLTSVSNNISTARQQLKVDAANTEVLRMIRDTLPPSGEREYVDKIGLHLTYLWNCADIRVDYVHPQELPGTLTEENPVYLLESIVENQPLMTARMGAIEPSVREWNRALGQFVRETAVVEGRVERSIRLHNFNLIRLLCPLIPNRRFCEVDEPLLDRRIFSYGWELFRIEGSRLEGREAGPRLAAAREAAQ